MGFCETLVTSLMLLHKTIQELHAYNGSLDSKAMEMGLHFSTGAMLREVQLPAVQRQA